MRHAALAYAPIGLAPGCVSNCTPTDLIFAATTGETLVFQGDPQPAGGMQFSFDAGQLNALDLASLLKEGAPLALQVTAGDLDGDGDGDLAYAATFEGDTSLVTQFVLVRNDCAAPTAELVDVSCSPSPDPTVGAADDTLAFNVELSVPKPSTFPEHPTHARVTIYVRQYYPLGSPNPNPPIWYAPIFSQKLALTPPAPGSVRSTLALALAPTLLPPPMLGRDVLAYVQVTPLLDLENAVELVGPSSNFVGADGVVLLDALCENESATPDELYEPGYCQGAESDGCGGESGAPLINELHRRKRIRPIGTPPQ